MRDTLFYIKLDSGYFYVETSLHSAAASSSNDHRPKIYANSGPSIREIEIKLTVSSHIGNLFVFYVCKNPNLGIPAVVSIFNVFICR